MKKENRETAGRITNMEFTLDTTLLELHENGIISARTFNCLYYKGLKTLGQIWESINSPIDLMNYRNFGQKSFAEIEPILNSVAHKSGNNDPKTKEELQRVYGERIVEIISDAYVTVTAGETELKAYLQAAFPQPIDMHNFVMSDLDNMLAVVEDYSLDENLEIRHSYKQFIDLAMEKMEDAQEAGNAIYVEYKRKRMDLAVKMESFSHEQIAKYFLSPTAFEYIERIYQEQVESKLSVRSKNFVSKYLPHFSDLIKYAEEPLSSYRNICPGQYMMKTLTEIFQFNQKFKHEFDRVSRLSDDEIQFEFLKREYPYLDSNQRQFVLDFMKKHAHAPLFFLLLKYIRLSDNRSNKIYCLLHGLFDGKKRTLSEIADAMDLTRERCRQIANGTIEVQKSRIADDDNWVCYNELFELPFIYENIEEYASLRDEEHLSVDFEAFASLVRLIADFKIEEVEGHTFLVNRKIKGLDLSSCLDTFYSIINAKFSTDTYVPIDSILFTVPEPLRPKMKVLIKYIATDIYKVRITDEEQLYMPQNHIDIAEELYDILEKQGEPMHVEDIFKEFKTRYPDHKYTDALQIKPSLFKHPHIKSIGKTSCYALDIWEGIYFGSIRDLLVDLLSASDVPLHLDILYDGVSEHYPNTTKASLAATMEDENLQRFVEFEGSYFGLTSKNYPAEYVVAASIQRYRFEDRFQMFKDFVDTYHRFPSYNGSEQEASLMRWYYNVTNGVLSMTEEQKKMFDDTLMKYDQLGYPQSSTENEFLIKCQDVKEYIHRHHTLPTNSDAPELYAWLRRSRDNYDSYTDKRRQYMADLLNYVLSFGFSV
ncbi:MAG: hypothetical protein IKS53_06090 [Bacteroidales bacterium]|nr:hypothetical protein [Bacteroidales bacterium]